MALNIKNKQEIVNEVSNVAKDALSAVVASFRGITADKMINLYKASRDADVYLRVINNTLVKRVVSDTAYECLKKVFIGPTIIAFSKKKIGTAARLFKEFAKTNPTFQIKAGVIEGKFIFANQIDYLANFPTYEEAVARLILIMKEASTGKLIRVIRRLCD